MKIIEEYSTQGVSDKSFNGKVTTYTKNIKKLPKNDLRLAILKPFGKKPKKDYKNNISFINMQAASKIMSILLVGTISISCLTGCSIGKKQSIPSVSTSEEITNEEPAVLDPTLRIPVTISNGDNLWSIAKLCYDNDSDVQEMVNKIEKDNNISKGSILQIDEVIYIDVPYSHLVNFGYLVNISEPTEWEKEEHFIMEAWDGAGNNTNQLFLQNHQEVFEGTEDNPGYLLKIASDKDTLEALKQEQTFFNEKDPAYNSIVNSIDEVTNRINEAYKDAIKLTETNTGKKYGKDYQLSSTYVIVSEPNTATKTLNN